MKESREAIGNQKAISSFARKWIYSHRLAFGNMARPRLSGGSRWGGQRRPGWLSRPGRAKREGSAQHASSHRTVIGVHFGQFARRVTVYSSIGVKFSVQNLTPDWIWVSLRLTIEAVGPRVLAA